MVTVGAQFPLRTPELKKLGGAEVLTPGANTDEIDDFVKDAVAGRESRERES